MPIPRRLLSKHNGSVPDLVTRKRRFYGGNGLVTLYRRTKSGYLMYLGSIRLVLWNNDKYFEAHSAISRKSERGKGYGIYLYSQAADYAAELGKTLTSSVTSITSDAAKRVYKSKRFREFYDIKKSGRRWYVRPKTRK